MPPRSSVRVGVQPTVPVSCLSVILCDACHFLDTKVTDLVTHADAADFFYQFIKIYTQNFNGGVPLGQYLLFYSLKWRPLQYAAGCECSRLPLALPFTDYAVTSCGLLILLDYDSLLATNFTNRHLCPE